MNILITGGAGQLGTELKMCFDRRASALGTPDILKHENKITCIDVDKLDITDLDAVRTLFLKERYDCVINCAAYTNVDKCETDIEAAFAVNAIGPRNLAIICEETGAKLIHVSTDYVFRGTGSKPFCEWDICEPKSVYGKTKYLGEQYVREFCTKYFIVRTAWLYGYYGNNFVKTMLKLAQSKDEITVVNDQRGNPTNAEDLAHHILKLATTEQYGVYHGTGTGECSWYEFASKIMEYAKTGTKVNACTSEEFAQMSGRPADRPAYSSLENLMFKATVGDEFRTWQQALECFINNIKEN